MRSRPESVPPPSLKKLSKQDAKKVILGLAANSLKPLLIGITAVRLGSCWTLEEVEEIFQELVVEGDLRPITQAEKERFDLREGFVIAGVDIDP